jgi:hypothetical protein
MLLQTLRDVLARSATPPVIIVQSDHGHGRVFTDLVRGFTLGHDVATDAQVGERMGVFAAYHFAGADTVMRDDISAVNVMRGVARTLWNDTTPPLPDSSWYSAYETGFEFHAVPAARTRPPSPRNPR